jgi:hypothetical protein
LNIAISNCNEKQEGSTRGNGTGRYGKEQGVHEEGKVWFGRVGWYRYTPSLLAVSTVFDGRAGAALGSDASFHGCA